jgi:hypothetical protein
MGLRPNASLYIIIATARVLMIRYGMTELNFANKDPSKH